MRRLHVITSVDPAGGGPIEGIKQLAAATQRYGHETEVVSLDEPESDWVKDFPLPVYPLGPIRTSYYYSPRLIPWLRENAPRYDAVVINGLWQYNSYGAYRALRRSTVPYFVFTHGMLDPWFRHAFPLKHLKKCLYWPWGQYPVLRDAAAVCFTCEQERRLARESFRPYQCREVVVNYGTRAPDSSGEAIKRQSEAFYQAFPHLCGKRLFLFLSRIHEKKGCDLLIRAFAREVAPLDRNAHLVMAGPDQVGWQATLEQMVRQFGIENQVTFTGMLSGDVKMGAFRTAEVFILPSHQENFGIAVAEALSCQVPVLISDKVNICSEIAMDGAGLVDNDTEEGTARMLARWIQMDRNEQQTMQAAAFACFNNRFEIDRAGKRLIEVLSGTVK